MKDKNFDETLKENLTEEEIRKIKELKRKTEQQKKMEYVRKFKRTIENL